MDARNRRPLWGHYNWTTFPSVESLADMDMISMSRRYQDKVARRAASPS